MQDTSYSFTAINNNRAWVKGARGVVSHQATLSGVGAVTATIIHEGTNDPSDPNATVTIWTSTLSGTNNTSDSGVASHSWAYVRSRCSAITGTNAVARSSMSGSV